ncbi:class I SAM-dependent methyltransferase [Glycomyces lechevalierae]|uniref:SAM-dependent methyltransferase n=1 Tax=Glycomyces lechevalierae TaxID=256034 RepID=A0A9X3PE05_9ACTN|nr:class I SAM-dependent methyltransferase [Glycomyces lechevalierae]MDA1383575.1 class I SAM-dependent methyltransferase [Glycomyces lechevalierae]MDR7341436.1 SAM-dependent methyltransferase [Glycomyces lechevalierae]
MTFDVERTMSNYRDTRNLKTRISIYDYRTPRIDPTDLAAELMPADPHLVLDVGCGSGRYVQRLRRDHPEAVVVGIDAAPGMLAEVEPPIMVADAQAIPYPDASADAVLAMHMLYHVPDIAKAVAEFRRVLKPGGTLLVSTNVDTDKGAYFALMKRAFTKVLGPDAPPVDSVNVLFNSANAPGYLEAEFDSVESFEDHGTVAVPEPGPLLAFIDSTRSFFDIDDTAFDAIMAAIGEELDTHFAMHDHFEYNKGLIIYRCR